jgi:beta-phosphoglucomutase family hydrolase
MSVRWDEVGAVLFDLDGVLTPTVEVHMRAWRRLFDGFFAENAVVPPYTDADYFTHVDGKPRYDGVRAALASRGVRLPDGDPADPPDSRTVCGLGNAKNVIVNRLLAEDGIVAYPGSVELVDQLAARGVPMAVVSSSRNAPAVLTAAGLAARFEVVVDGTVAAREHLAGKPAPDTFAYATALLGVMCASAAVVEDALSGVAAGRAGGFGVVVGVDQGAGARSLRDAGADIVVTDLRELVVGAAGTEELVE